MPPSIIEMAGLGDERYRFIAGLISVFNMHSSCDMVHVNWVCQAFSKIKNDSSGSEPNDST